MPPHGAAGVPGSTIGAMGILVKLLWIKLWWRMLRRLLRCMGWGAVLVPVAAVGMAVFGVSLWTLRVGFLAVTAVVPILAWSVARPKPRLRYFV